MPSFSIPILPGPDRCTALFEGRPTGPRCERPAEHPGDHSAVMWWATTSAEPDPAPTAKLPPVRDRILPRPPAPAVRELKGAELLRALADELRDYDEADDALAWPPCNAGVVNGRLCRWPDTGHPCLGYGSTGCGMKAQES